MHRLATDTRTLGSGSGVSNADPGLANNNSRGSEATTAGDLGAGQHAGKRQKTGQGRDQRGGVVDSITRKRKRLLADAAKTLTGEDALKSFLQLVMCVQATEIFKVRTYSIV